MCSQGPGTWTAAGHRCVFPWRPARPICFLSSYLGIDHQVKGERAYRLLDAKIRISPRLAPSRRNHPLRHPYRQVRQTGRHLSLFLPLRGAYRQRAPHHHDRWLRRLFHGAGGTQLRRHHPERRGSRPRHKGQRSALLAHFAQLKRQLMTTPRWRPCGPAMPPAVSAICSGASCCRRRCACRRPHAPHRPHHRVGPRGRPLGPGQHPGRSRHPSRRLVPHLPLRGRQGDARHLDVRMLRPHPAGAAAAAGLDSRSKRCLLRTGAGDCHCRLKCRGPVTPASRKVHYVVEIKEIGYHPEPYVVADAHMYADGHYIVFFKDMSMQMSGVTLPAIEAFWQGTACIPERIGREFDPGSSPYSRREQILAICHRQPLQSLWGAVCRFRSRTGHRPPARPALLFHGSGDRHRTAALGAQSRRLGGSPVRRAVRCLVFCRRSQRRDAFLRAAGNRPAALRLAGGLCRIGLAQQEGFEVPQPRRQSQGTCQPALPENTP